ncbi:MAG: hypothetical protein ACYSU3_00690 [Planctomycetota bacterium]
MYKRFIYIITGLAMLALTVSMAQALSHNDNNNINCVDCHFGHTGSLVPRDAGQEILCKTCHNPTDPNAGHLSDIGLHMVDSNTTIIDCGSCHEVHNPGSTDPQTALNLSYVRGNTSKYVVGALEPAQFEVRPDHFAFSSSPYNGICQSCHVSITRHTNDGFIDHNPGTPADNAHEIGTDCISCHAHTDSFLGSGGSCLDCHDEVQDDDPNDGIPARRAVASEFGLGSRHVMGGTATDADCAVCHMESETDHKNGLIDLRDPDTGTGLTGFTQFTRNTASDTLETWVTDVQDNFCMKCHDTDGATAAAVDPNNPLRPFSAEDRDVPDVFGQFGTGNSFYHPVRGAGNNPYAIPSGSNGNNITMEPPWNQDSTHDQISCFDCHMTNGHGHANQRMLRSAIDLDTMETTTAKKDLPSGMGSTVDAFCRRCHKASVYESSSDPESVGSIFEYHGLGQNGHGGDTGNELGCMGCHAGIVDFSAGVGNGSLSGNIHGGSFTWPAGSFSSGVATEYFMLGGWMSGWEISGNGFCRGGDCQHRNSSKDYTR